MPFCRGNRQTGPRTDRASGTRRVDPGSRQIAARSRRSSSNASASSRPARRRPSPAHGSASAPVGSGVRTSLSSGGLVVVARRIGLGIERSVRGHPHRTHLLLEPADRQYAGARQPGGFVRRRRHAREQAHLAPRQLVRHQRVLEPRQRRERAMRMREILELTRGHPRPARARNPRSARSRAARTHSSRAAARRSPRARGAAARPSQSAARDAHRRTHLPREANPPPPSRFLRKTDPVRVPSAAQPEAPETLSTLREQKTKVNLLERRRKRARTSPPYQSGMPTTAIPTPPSEPRLSLELRRSLSKRETSTRLSVVPPDPRALPDTRKQPSPKLISLYKRDSVRLESPR